VIPVNQQHREDIAKHLVASITSLLNGKCEHQLVKDSYGKSHKRIIISYEHEERT